MYKDGQENQTKIEAFNHLIQVCKAGEYGFRLAAHEVTNKEYRNLLLTSAIKRHDFATSLEERVRDLGGTPESHAGLEAGIHRTWMNLRHAISQRNDQVVLNECRRGEEAALKAYQDTFEEKTLADFETLLQTQFMSIMETRDKLRDLTKNGSELPPPEKTLLHL